MKTLEELNKLVDKCRGCKVCNDHKAKRISFGCEILQRAPDRVLDCPCQPCLIKSMCREKCFDYSWLLYERGIINYETLILWTGVKQVR